MPATRLVFVFGAALGIAVLMKPAMRALAVRCDGIELPAERKGHPRPTPLLGGVAIWRAVVTSLIPFSDRYVVRELAAEPGAAG